MINGHDVNSDVSISKHAHSVHTHKNAHSFCCAPMSCYDCKFWFKFGISTEHASYPFPSRIQFQVLIEQNMPLLEADSKFEMKKSLTPSLARGHARDVQEYFNSANQVLH